MLLLLLLAGAMRRMRRRRQHRRRMHKRVERGRCTRSSIPVTTSIVLILLFVAHERPTRRTGGQACKFCKAICHIQTLLTDRAMFSRASTHRGKRPLPERRSLHIRISVHIAAISFRLKASAIARLYIWRLLGSLVTTVPFGGGSCRTRLEDSRLSSKAFTLVSCIMTSPATACLLAKCLVAFLLPLATCQAT